MVRRLLALAMFVALAGCQADPPPAGKPSKANEPPAKAVRPVPAREGELKLPDGMRLPSVQYVEAAQSWNDRLATLTTSERAQLESLNFRYYGTLEFNSPEEQRKLVAAGVPMPEEWLAASRMSDEELASLADARSPKASLFFADGNSTSSSTRSNDWRGVASIPTSIRTSSTRGRKPWSMPARRSR